MKLTVGIVAVGLLLASTAKADIPPHDYCWDEGNACSNAAPDFASPGVCRAFKQTFQVPGSDEVYESIILKCIPTP